MSIPFLPLFLFDLGVQENRLNLWAGVVHSSAFLVGAFMAPLWGAIADKYGKKKMVIRAGLSLAVIYALIGFVRNPWELVLARMLHGFAGGFVPASMAIVASVAPKEKMGWSLGMMQAGTMSGGILGPLLGGLLAEWFGLRLSFVVAGVVIFMATLAVIFWVAEGESNQQSRLNGGSIVQGLKVVVDNQKLLYLLLLLITFQLSINMIMPLMTLHIADLSGSMEGAVLSSGFVLAIIGISGIVASPIWGRMGEHKGYHRILYVCFILSGLIISMQYFVHHLWVFTLVQFIFGFFMAGIVPTINTLVVNHTPESFRGRSFGVITSANQIGAMTGPLIGGVLGIFLKIHWIFVVVGIIMLGSGMKVFLSTKKEQEPQRRSSSL